VHEFGIKHCRAELAAADGVLGFWKALSEVWPKTREQRCWVHETTNVRKRAAKSQHAKASGPPIWMVETKAEAAFDAFIETYAVKY
jgi:putative transposase